MIKQFFIILLIASVIAGFCITYRICIKSIKSDEQPQPSAPAHKDEENDN